MITTDFKEVVVGDKHAVIPAELAEEITDIVWFDTSEAARLAHAIAAPKRRAAPYMEFVGGVIGGGGGGGGVSYSYGGSCGVAQRQAVNNILAAQEEKM